MKNGDRHKRSRTLIISCFCCRADLTAAGVIPDVLTGVDPVKTLKLDIKYGDTPVTSKGVRLPKAQVLNAPAVQVCPSA